MPTIKLIDVTKKFGKGSLAVDHLNMEIKDGEFVSLLGPSGCGKTTTLRMIAGLETPTEGEIYFDDECVFSDEKGVNLSPDKRNVGFLFQNYALWPHMTVYNNISFGLENMKWPKEKIDARVKEICETMRISEYMNRYPAELSGGQQQRVAIARTLAPNPRVLLMDEPLSNLDAKLRNDMRTELKRLHKNSGSTFVYVTHDQSEAMTLSTKVALIRNGLLQQYCPPLQLYGEPNNVFCADFMGNPSMNFVEMHGVRKGDDVLLENKEFKLLFKPNDPIDIKEENDYVLGIRPEFIKIADKGIRSSVISSLPSGMETTLSLGVGDIVLSAVVFGSIDFAMESTEYFDFEGNGYVLFDKESQEKLTLGSLKIVE
ncbi:MAG: ABC transporter ATP-binding protein [Erysipelotrichaceae bacterium]|nr:ABC transporter ATP-binding protein [Erysipelotrichaceae bacterium]